MALNQRMIELLEWFESNTIDAFSDHYNRPFFLWCSKIEPKVKDQQLIADAVYGGFLIKDEDSLDDPFFFDTWELALTKKGKDALVENRTVENAEEEAEDGEWRPGRWFTKQTNGQIDSDRLRKAAERGKIRRRRPEKKGQWEYLLSEVRSLHPQHKEFLT
jgi:hypothetical protein